MDGKIEFQVTPREAMITALILDMFYRSAKEKREVRVEEIVPGEIGS